MDVKQVGSFRLETMEIALNSHRKAKKKARVDKKSCRDYKENKWTA